MGEGDEVLSRLKDHNKDDSKSFWETAYLFVSKDDGLTKAHVRWLEAHSIQLPLSAKRAKVTNASTPSGGNLPEADLAEMDEFLEQIQLLMPALGFSGFEPVQAAVAPAGGAASPESLQLSYSGGGYSATGYLSDGNFLVVAGGVAIPNS